ncbi:hypothetical protein DPMN_075822 [Dreissena polymorpha]|uniref:Uncharacterized protein n=1 Tax=Dreissena polymorpha TaxID=45954 RepID=A0A9D3YLV2_DREPO|nr:hypothetical protein DPMN_075822 [Dreissena polymorpha]
MEISLLGTGVQLMTMLTNSFLTMKETLRLCLQSSPLKHILCPLDVSQKPSDLASAS